MNILIKKPDPRQASREERGGFMKLLLLAVSVLFFSCTATRPPEEQNLHIENITAIDGLTKDAIYEGVKMWIASNFKSSKAVIEYDNKDQGTIIGNGSMIQECEGADCIRGNWTILFTMRVDIKDGKIRTEFYNLRQIPSYDPIMGYDKFKDGPLTENVNLDAIKTKLMAFGPAISNSLSGPKSKNW